MTDQREAADVDTDVFERTESEPPPPSVVAPRVPLPPAGMMSLGDADALLRWRDASVIAVVGERNGGKTTLVTELYEKFLRGPFAGTLFSHSLSLLGFERKTFLSRSESGRVRPDTQRTSEQDGLSFFHLAVSNEGDLQRTDLLISERAGEIYGEVRNRPASAKGVVEVRKAKTVAFVLDGERIADKRRRAEAFANVRNVARAFADSGAIAGRAEVQLVTTKCDLLNGDDLVAAVEALSEFEQRFIATFRDRYAEVSVHRTAARDPDGLVEAGFGLTELFHSWLRLTARPVAAPPQLPVLKDEFDRLLLWRKN